MELLLRFKEGRVNMKEEMLFIDLSYGDLRIKPLATAVTNPVLVCSLDLSGNNISTEAFIETIEKHISHMINLEELDMKDNKIGSRGTEHLCKTIIQHCVKIKYLDLSENGIFDESLLHVAYLLRESCLERLFLVSNHLTPRGISTLCDGILSSEYIRDLSLAFNVLGDTGISILAKALRDHPSLRSLDISDNRIGDAGAVQVAEHLILSPDSRLESLNLSVNCIGDVGFLAIAEAVTQTRSTCLFHLDLGGNSNVGPIGREGLIKCVQFMSHLQSLDLSSCEFSDEDAQGLVTAVLCKTCGIVSMEWFNNPEMRPETEKALYDALEAKKTARLNKEKYWCQLSLFSGVAFGVVMLMSAVVLLRQRRR